MPTPPPAIDAHRLLLSGGRHYAYHALGVLDALGYGKLDRLPNSLKVLLENALRAYASGQGGLDDVLALAAWQPRQARRGEVRFRPARILMQDFTGVPALVDLAALRDAVAAKGADPARVNPKIPVDLVVDHSVMVDHFNSADALQLNMAKEFERNAERYRFLRWAQGAFENLRIVPPGGGICHQVNLEYLASVVCRVPLDGGDTLIFPDSLVGTDSHTTMVNALGVLGWGVGGIEAEAAMLGQPLEVPIPDVAGVRLAGRLAEGVGATDLVLALTERLRQEGVVGCFVEFYGPGLRALSLADRATLANMAPEYGATCAFFPVDRETLRYLRASARPESQIALVETYAKAQGWWHDDKAVDPAFTRSIDVDLGDIAPCLAGPRRPQDRVALADVARSFQESSTASSHQPRQVSIEGAPYAITDGSIVIAAITSCTNTSNPAAMIAAGLLARNAVKRGLKSKPWVMTSLAPGSRVVTEYLTNLGLRNDLDALGFHLVAYGCAACVGNTAPLAPPLAKAIGENDLNVAAVLSGNRNFEARINPLIKSNYLASPALVIAYALAGSLQVDLTRDPLGMGGNGNPVLLRDIWPSNTMVEAAMSYASTPDMFRTHYAGVFDGPAAWQNIRAPAGLTYAWDAASSYIRRPPFLSGGVPRPSAQDDIIAARILLLLNDGVTTDHISPAGPIGHEGPAGDYLRGQGIAEADLNAYGARRGNHEVMIRGAFANVRLRNEMLPNRLGGFTRVWPDGEELPVFEASERYRQANTPLVVLAGKDYGGGSSRDWAAKGTALLGVKAVIAESFERIHRANLIALGVLPLQFTGGTSWRSLSLDGSEALSLIAPNGQLSVQGKVTLSIRRDPPSIQMAELLCRIDTRKELEVYRQGGLFPLLLQQFQTSAPESAPEPADAQTDTQIASTA